MPQQLDYHKPEASPKFRWLWWLAYGLFIFVLLAVGTMIAMTYSVYRDFPR